MLVKLLGSVNPPLFLKCFSVFHMQQATACLAELDQSPSTSILDPLKPFFDSIVKPELLKHQDWDVKLLVATCFCEITRITAPEVPYSNDDLKVPSIYSGYLII